MAEMRGWQDENGRSPFWDHLGSKFFGLRFESADHLSAVGDKGTLVRDQLNRTEIKPAAASFTISVPVSGPGEDRLEVALPYFYCADGGEGLCKMAVVVWDVKFAVDPAAESSQVVLKYTQPE